MLKGYRFFHCNPLIFMDMYLKKTIFDSLELKALHKKPNVSHGED